MNKDNFLTGFFRVVTILTPLLMLIKSIVDKNFKKIGIEITIFSIYLLLLVFLFGFVKGFHIGKQTIQRDEEKIQDG